MRQRWLRRIAVFGLLAATAAPAAAAEPVKIGLGYGLAFLPIYICEDLKLIEKHARQDHLDVRASFQRFPDAETLQDAIATGEIDMGPFGTAPLLMAWAKAKGTTRQVFAVSGIASLPLTLLSDRPDMHGIADIRPSDRIAMPTLSSPQMYLLEMQSQKVFGRYDRLQSQVVALPHADAIAALVAGAGPITAYFSSPPFTQLALRDPAIHRVLDSADVIGGKSSFLIMGATKAFIETHPQIAEVIDQAMDDAARLIHDDPRRAAQIYLTHEPSKILDAAAIEAVLQQDSGAFGSAVYGVQAFADFMAKRGQLPAPPQSWKQVVAPALANSPSS